MSEETLLGLYWCCQGKVAGKLSGLGVLKLHRGSRGSWNVSGRRNPLGVSLYVAMICWSGESEGTWEAVQCDCLVPKSFSSISFGTWHSQDPGLDGPLFWGTVTIFMLLKKLDLVNIRINSSGHDCEFRKTKKMKSSIFQLISRERGEASSCQIHVEVNRVGGVHCFWVCCKHRTSHLFMNCLLRSALHSSPSCIPGCSLANGWSRLGVCGKHRTACGKCLGWQLMSLPFAWNHRSKASVIFTGRNNSLVKKSIW